MKRIAALLSLLLVSASSAGPAAPSLKSDHLFVWTADADGQQSDFLAVIDLDRGSPTYGTVVATAPTGVKASKSHHSEHDMPAGGILFANGFGAGRTWLFDLRQPRRPSVRASFADAGTMMHAHSFGRLPSGNVLATYQMTGHDNDAPGGLAEISADGVVVRTSPVTGLDPVEFVRPYSLAIVPKLDRIVTTTADMHSKAASRTVQIWRLSDLKLLSTIPLPAGPRGKEQLDSAEPRLMADGRTVLVSTFNCGLFLLDGLAGDRPSARLVHDFGTGECALPVVAGRYWVQTDTALPGLVSLDISKPQRPRVVDRLVLPAGQEPHWISLSPDGRRIVISGGGKALKNKILLAKIDPKSGRLALDPTLSIDFDRTSWPHGDSGKAIPHGAVFSR